MKQYRSATNTYDKIRLVTEYIRFLIPIRYGQLRFFNPCLIFDNYQSLAADLPGPVNDARTDTDFTDMIRIVTDRTDKYGSPIRRLRHNKESECRYMYWRNTKSSL